MKQRIEQIEKRLKEASAGVWEVVEDERYCGGFGCTPDGCHGHPTGRGTWVDGPAIVEFFEAGYGETEEETREQYNQACADAEFIACAKDDIEFLLNVIEDLEKDMDDMLYQAERQGVKVDLH